MPRYFPTQSKVKSFLRQIYLYRFERIMRGPSKGSWSHPMFVRSDRSRCLDTF